MGDSGREEAVRRPPLLELQNENNDTSLWWGWDAREVQEVGACDGSMEPKDWEPQSLWFPNAGGEVAVSAV